MKKFILTTALLFCVCLISAAQSVLVKGVVSDKEGYLPGITVMIRGTQDGTLTDLDGFFTIRCNIGDILVFSGIGYEVQTLKVSSKVATTLVKIVMKETSYESLTPSSCDFAYVDSPKHYAFISRRRVSVPKLCV